MNLQKLLPALIPFIMLCSCNEFDEEQNSKGSVHLTYSPASSGNHRMDLSKELQPSAVFISISNEQGEMVRNTEKFPLIKTGDAFITKDIELKTGNYTLKKFIVTDSIERAIYLAPKADSDKAAHVSNPLPIDFQVQAESASDIEVEVLPSNTGSVSDFGYAAFSFEIVDKMPAQRIPFNCDSIDVTIDQNGEALDSMIDETMAEIREMVKKSRTNDANECYFYFVGGGDACGPYYTFGPENINTRALINKICRLNKMKNKYHEYLLNDPDKGAAVCSVVIPDSLVVIKNTCNGCFSQRQKDLLKKGSCKQIW